MVTRLVVAGLYLVKTVTESFWLVRRETWYFCSLEPAGVFGCGCVHGLGNCKDESVEQGLSSCLSAWTGTGFGLSLGCHVTSGHSG